MFEIFGMDMEEFMQYAPYLLLVVVSLNIVLSFTTLLMPKSPFWKILKMVSVLLWIAILAGAWYFSDQMFQQVNESMEGFEEE